MIVIHTFYQIYRENINLRIQKEIKEIFQTNLSEAHEPRTVSLYGHHCT